jgi:hypothetical protein
MPAQTPDNIIKTIYNSISTSIIDSMQSAQSQVLSTQDINITCTDEAVYYITNDYIRCIKGLSKKKIENTIIEKLCKPPINCSAKNVKIKSSLNVTDIMKQTGKIQSNIEDSLSNNIKQDLKSTNSSTAFLSTVDKLDINNLVVKISENTQSITQKISDKVTQQQGLTLYNYEANNITITSVLDIITESVQELDSVQLEVTKITQEMIQAMSNNTDSLREWVVKIAKSSLAIIGLLFLSIYIVKRKDSREFVQFILPYVIYIIAVCVIILVHTIFLPSYILIKNNEKTKQIDTKKLYMYVIIYSISFGLMELIYYKIIKKPS